MTVGGGGGVTDGAGLFSFYPFSFRTAPVGRGAHGSPVPRSPGCSACPSPLRRQVAMKFLTSLEDIEGGDEMKSNVADCFVVVHTSVGAASLRMKDDLRRSNYVTPTNYLELVAGYIKILEDKRNELGDQCDKLQVWNGFGKRHCDRSSFWIFHKFWRFVGNRWVSFCLANQEGAPCAVPALCEKSAVFHHR